MRLAQRESELMELMDDPDCDLVWLRRTLRRFGIVNRAVSRWGVVYRSYLRPLITRLNRPARILDIGTGGGDVLRYVTQLARRDGLEIQSLGIDPDPRAIEVARQAGALPGMSFRQASSSELIRDGERFDIVISNHLLHHLGKHEFDAVIADSESLASLLCAHSDIARSRLAYLAFAVGVTPLAPGSFLRTDGLRSIRRSYTFEELTARLPSGWRVDKPGAFRLLAVRETAP